MNNTIFWIALASYAMHILEEYFYDWKNWAHRTLNLQVDWTGFYITNMVVLFLGVACATIGWSFPIFSLAYPGLMFINGIFMHIFPVIKNRRFSPGVITSCLLFLPVSLIAFKDAMDQGIPFSTILLAILLGGLILAYPILLIATKDRPFFNQKS